MQTPEELIEKYKNDMLEMMKRSYCPYQETQLLTNDNTEVVQENASDDEIVAVSDSVNASPAYDEIDDNEKTEEVGKPDDLKQSFGTLKIRAYSGNIAYPIETALVKIYDSQDRLICEGYTDQSGIFDAGQFETIEKNISESPNFEKGYATYKIVVTHPRFNTVVFENVPIFEGVESIQNARMELGYSDDETVINESEPDNLRRKQNAR